jgi:hypothetical protein
VTVSQSIAAHRPSKRQVQVAAADVAASLALELAVVGVARRVRRGRRAGRYRLSALLRAVVSAAAAQGAIELSRQRRWMATELDRRVEAQMHAARRSR